MLRYFNICFLLLFTYPAYGAEALTPLNFKGLYVVSLGSVPIAKMGVEIEQDSAHYSAAGDITISGLLKLFTSHASHTTVDGSGHDYVYATRDYESRYRTKKKKKYVAVRYDHGAVSETLDPPENPAKRPPVTLALKKNSVDPLSFIIEMRRHMASAKTGDKFTIDVYDGRRLTRAKFSVGDKKVLRLGGKKRPVIVANVKRELLAGFTDSERADYDPKEPPLAVYFSDDARRIPLKLETSFWLGTLSAVLTKECTTGESCLLGIKG